MWPAFPTSDYYGASVAMGVAPVRRSRVPFVVDVQDGLGVSFVPFADRYRRPCSFGAWWGRGAHPRTAAWPESPARFHRNPGCFPAVSGLYRFSSGTEIQA